MKALVFNGIGKIALKNVKAPALKHQTDALVKITMSAICGTDLHFIRGTIQGMKKGTILGHEGVGIVEKIGSKVRNFKIGDRVIVPSTIGCGKCPHCLEEHYALCDNANPHGHEAGTAFYGGPAGTGPFNGMQAEKVRVPFADVNLVKIPDELNDEQVILLSDILPTSYMAVEMANVSPIDTVAVFGCGPVGQLAIACLKQLRVKQIFAIDHVKSRLKIAQLQGARIINFDEVNPVEELRKLTKGKGPTRIIDAVGVDAEHASHCSPAMRAEFKKEQKKIAPKTRIHDGNWIPGSGPSQVFRWAVDAIAKNGVISIIGVYSDLSESFPIGKATGKNVTIRMGDCNHRKYLPMLLSWVKNGKIDMRPFLTQKLPFTNIIEAYKHFDKREDNWLKVALTFGKK
ncbi:alcohol dehydrogenase catalytic domain-containing protein [Candidatus Dependentiae bacterium]|nr:alcohol dehydrogenase catalytic domain-containing protein [Candidatus Dependentiae bacterium]